MTQVSSHVELLAQVSFEFGQCKAEASLTITNHVVENAYFATMKEEIVYDIKQSTKMHTAKSGDYLGKIASTLGVSVTELKTQNKLKSDNVKIGQKFSVTIEEKTKKGKKITFTPLTKASVGSEVYIVIETKDLEGKTIKINIRQGKETVIGEIDKALTITQNGQSIMEIKACVGELADYEKHLNKEYLKDLAVAQVTLAPKEEKEIKEWNTKIKATPDKKTHLYLLIEADVKEKVKYYGKNDDGSDDHEQRFRNIDGKWLELKTCECCFNKVDKDGFFDHSKITKKRISALEKYSWKQSVQYIILHRTVTPGTTRVFNSFKSGIGTHFLVAKDGTIYQTATLNKTTSHIRNGYNSSTVGIEVVGMPLDKDGKPTFGRKTDPKPSGTWESLTEKQAKSVACLVKGLLKHYNLNKLAIKNHEDLQAKEPMEGGTVYNAIKEML